MCFTTVINQNYTGGCVCVGRGCKGCVCAGVGVCKLVVSTKRQNWYCRLLNSIIFKRTLLMWIILLKHLALRPCYNVIRFSKWNDFRQIIVWNDNCLMWANVSLNLFKLDLLDLIVAFENDSLGIEIASKLQKKANSNIWILFISFTAGRQCFSFCSVRYADYHKMGCCIAGVWNGVS